MTPLEAVAWALLTFLAFGVVGYLVCALLEAAWSAWERRR